MNFLWTALSVLFLRLLASAQANFYMANNDHKNVRNLLDSISANDAKNRQTYREIIQHKVVQEQHVFDGLKNNLKDAKRANFYRLHHEGRKQVTVVKRNLPTTCSDAYQPTWAEKETSNFAEKVEAALENGTATSEGKGIQSVLMVCSTNNCRSPIAAAVFRELVKEQGLEHKWRVDSAGIYVNSPEARWPMDKRARDTLLRHGIKNISHAARMVQEKDFSEFDYMLGMDHANVEDLNERKPPGSRVIIELLSSYDPRGTKFMRHPYYDRNTTGFEECYKISARACAVFLNKHL